MITGASRAAVDSPDSATFRALAWSQDDDTSGDPIPYTGEDPYADPYTSSYSNSYDTGTTRAVAQYHAKYDEHQPRARRRMPLLVFGVAAAFALVAVGGVAIALTSATEETRPAPAPRR